MAAVMFPSPNEIGLPEKYGQWRTGQAEAVLQLAESTNRFRAAVLPTGAGKSLIAMGLAQLLGARTVMLTSTVALQRQLERDFKGWNGTVLMLGQRKYECLAVRPGGELYSWSPTNRDQAVTSDQGPCHVGVTCSMREAGCLYYDALKDALRAPILITSYAWWFALYRAVNLGAITPQLLILDEAHNAPDELSSALGARIAARDVAELLQERLPRPKDLETADWIAWAGNAEKRMRGYLEGTKAHDYRAAIRLRRAQHLHRELARLSGLEPELIVAVDDIEAVRFDLIWAAPYAEAWLFRGAPHVLLTSATLAPHTLDLLGVPPTSATWVDQAEGFPKERRPVYLVKTAALTHRNVTNNPALENLWLARVDQIIRTRQDRKGIIHTVSYRRRDTILARSEYRRLMITHESHNAAEQIARFKASPPGTILVSPSVTTGYDFQFRECEYQILVKAPFPDSRDPTIQARTAIDKRYPSYVAIQEMIQAAGRGMRSFDDQCETFVIDDSARWLLNKHANMVPRWFRRAISRVDVVPAPPPPLPDNTRGTDPVEGPGAE